MMPKAPIRVASDSRDWKSWLSSHFALGGTVLYCAGIALSAAGGAAPWFHRIPLWAFSLIAALISLLTFFGQFIIVGRKHDDGQ